MAQRTRPPSSPGRCCYLIGPELFEQVQSVFRGYNKPKYGKHDFPFRGLLRCAYDDCLVTAELKKDKYVYYRCTGYRGRCPLPYFREEVLGDRLGQVIKSVHIPDDILAQLQHSLLTDKSQQEANTRQQRERLQRRLKVVRHRLEQAYLDKLDHSEVQFIFRSKAR